MIKNTSAIEKIDALILCGGLGRRLRNVVNNRQKCMAEVNGRPFLDFLIGYLESYKIKRIILCLGFKSKTVRSYYEKRRADGEILFSEEDLPLGTAGAIKNAKMLIKSNLFLVLNGDSICRVNLDSFLAFHKEKRAAATIGLVKSIRKKNTADYGLVQLNKEQEVNRFAEKTTLSTHPGLKPGVCSGLILSGSSLPRPEGRGLEAAEVSNKKGNFISCGIYLFEKELLNLIPKKSYYSLEYDLFPRLKNRFYGYIADDILIDIGTPCRYKEAQNYLRGRIDG